MVYRRKMKEFVCDICGKDFNKESQLKRHRKDAHDKRIEVVDVDVDEEVRKGWQETTRVIGTIDLNKTHTDILDKENV